MITKAPLQYNPDNDCDYQSATAAEAARAGTMSLLVTKVGKGNVFLSVDNGGRDTYYTAGSALAEDLRFVGRSGRTNSLYQELWDKPSVSVPAQVTEVPLPDPVAFSFTFYSRGDSSSPETAPGTEIGEGVGGGGEVDGGVVEFLPYWSNEPTNTIPSWVGSTNSTVPVTKTMRFRVTNDSAVAVKYSAYLAVESTDEVPAALQGPVILEAGGTDPLESDIEISAGANAEFDVLFDTGLASGSSAENVALSVISASGKYDTSSEEASTDPVGGTVYATPDQAIVTLHVDVYASSRPEYPITFKFKIKLFEDAP